jgi:hypothetical protein
MLFNQDAGKATRFTHAKMKISDSTLNYCRMRIRIRTAVCNKRYAKFVSNDRQCSCEKFVNIRWQLRLPAGH